MAKVTVDVNKLPIKDGYVYPRILLGIATKDWELVSRSVDEACETCLDVWYDYEPLRETIADAGYLCYTCFMKDKGIYPNSYICYNGKYPELNKSQRESHCGSDAMDRWRKWQEDERRKRNKERRKKL